MNHIITIKPDGHIQTLGNPLKLEGRIKSKRWSVIEPWPVVNPWRYWIFHRLRRVFGDKGRVADWTRRWRCWWRLKILQGPMQGYVSVCKDRAMLVAEEHQMYFESQLKEGVDL